MTSKHFLDGSTSHWGIRRLPAMLVMTLALLDVANAREPIPAPFFTRPQIIAPQPFDTSAPYSTKAMTTPEDVRRQQEAWKTVAREAPQIGLMFVAPELGATARGASVVTRIGAGRAAARVVGTTGTTLGRVGPSVAVEAEKAATAVGNVVTRERRLGEIASDAKAPQHIRGWLRQEANSVNRGQRSYVRNPRGYDLAHQRGREAAKGYDHRYSTLMPRQLHQFKHSIDRYGRRNLERPGVRPR